MKTFQLSATKRDVLGKKASKESRKSDLIPGVLYGGESENIHFEVESSAVAKLIYSPEIFLVAMTVDGKEYKAIIQALQFHPVTDKLIHMDLLQVSSDKAIVIEVPIKLEGLAAGVREGGKLSQEMRKIRVKALYNNVPENLVINVTELGLGKTIQVGELSFENLEIMNAKNAVVAAVKLTRAARGAKAAAASGKK